MSRPAGTDDGGTFDHQPALPGIVAGIVLAGGSSRRFGSPKLRAELDGRTLLEHALVRIEPLVDEVVIAIGRGADVAPSAALGLRRRVIVVRDVEAGGGPLVGLVGALGATTARLALVVGGDMPLLASAVGRLLLDEVVGASRGGTANAVGSGASGAAALEEAGVLRPLPCVVRVDLALSAAERLIASGERSLRSLLDALGAAGIPEARWRPLDPDGLSLVDVDTPADLAALENARSRRPG